MPQLHRLIQLFITAFYHVIHQLHLKICNQPEQATLFMTLTEYLVSETRALQVLVSNTSKQILN